MSAAFAYAGLDRTDGLLVSVLFGFSMLAIGAIGVAVWTITAGFDRQDARVMSSSGGSQ